MLLSGMSTMVVTPPAAAALVADVKPSQSVRPGSLTCTWASTTPGISTSSSARLDELGTPEVRVERLDRDDPAVLDPDQTADLAGRGHDAARADDQVQLGVRLGHVAS